MMDSLMLEIGVVAVGLIGFLLGFAFGKGLFD